MTSALKALLQRVEEFARTRTPAGDGGGWAPVTPAEMAELSEILGALLACKYEPDADGDLPVNFHLVDRTRYGRTSFFSIPYSHKFKTPEEYDEVIDLAAGNVRMAMDQLDVLLKCRKEQKRLQENRRKV